jgi:hypothetical protein
MMEMIACCGRHWLTVAAFAPAELRSQPCTHAVKIFARNGLTAMD